MNIAENKKFVREYFPEAKTETKNHYYYVTIDSTPHTLGSGSTPHEAWENAVEYIKEEK